MQLFMEWARDWGIMRRQLPLPHLGRGARPPCSAPGWGCRSQVASPKERPVPPSYGVSGAGTGYRPQSLGMGTASYRERGVLLLPASRARNKEPRVRGSALPGAWGAPRCSRLCFLPPCTEEAAPAPGGEGASGHRAQRRGRGRGASAWLGQGEGATCRSRGHGVTRQQDIFRPRAAEGARPARVDSGRR